VRAVALPSLGCALVLSALVAADAGAEKPRSGGHRLVIGSTRTIDNGVTGAGRVEVVLGAGGEADELRYRPLSGTPRVTGLLFELNHYVAVGAGGAAVQLGATFVTQPPTITGPNEVTSAGFFPGNGGTVFWSAVSTIAPGSTAYVTTLAFAGTAPFGPVRVVQYMDADVDEFFADNLVRLGTFGQPGFSLLTVSTSRNLGPAQPSPVVTNASCPGWAASPFSDLRDAIEGGGATFAPTGHVIDLRPSADPRFSGQPTWGPSDMTSAVACDLSPGAASAAIVFSVSVEERAAIPTLSQWAVIAMAGLLTAAALWGLRRRAPASQVSRR
jgi:hypothetical protein